MSKLNLRRFIFHLILVGLIVCPLFWKNVALATDYPSKPVEVIVAWPAGGRTDISSRMIAPFLEKNLGAPVVVVNKVGGGGLLGYFYTRDANSDGYTVMSGGQSLGLFQYQKPGGLSLWDYTYIARTFWIPVVLVVNGQSPFKNVRDLVEYARANPGKLRHGNSGTGNTTHVNSENFAKKFGIKFTQVPYKGEGPAVIGIGTGEVDLAFGAMAAFRSLIEEQKLRVLGVASENRNRLYPQVPTFREQGFDYIEMYWESVLAPKRLPKEVYNKLTEAYRKTLTNSQLVEKLEKAGFELSYQSGPEFMEWLKSWDKEVKDLIFELGLQLKQ